MAKIREVSEFVGHLSGENPADVFAWLTAPSMGRLENEWDEEED